ncbi:3-oxoacyl-ACP reductase [Streptomyces spiroverticillatus]|uniref:3-oxoacyl-ACP reductase n=1 Tax=Streptomyces finlayi TaxID=67296 RepID=A0A918WWI7_9ACTN|nr:SDR family oxidoreductase [Streptomyces finlayi]GHA07465.1 3-oxoacyl-ACP reductase [Streptomyces spiroverticillatus]GHC90819.1 3-oxoacyl-ACP reductase [Streptomyces finlayi]
MSRTVLVTGGGTGIGRAVAEYFAAQGDTVVITGRRSGPLKEVAAQSANVRAVTCDHTDPDALGRLLAELPEHIDVLINNAGGNTDLDAESGSEADLMSYARAFRANLEANLISAALTTKALESRLSAGGSVVQIGSIAADQASGSYGAAKAGLANWNLNVAAELGPRGITANVVSPGYIADTEFFRDRLSDERRSALVEATATGRAGVPSDIVGAVAFLASSAARHITGQVLNVNGGARSTR